ncbi:hypothetical protein [Zavarzinia compransoris]|uniref:Uncharacterized protein n=1 Tax=Zavarzinia compransoris TaxID=1264899 RepID=A0A317E8F2_9PROT|nr:hypothetical protein [Zavarzinia compransoris]PWR23377.1 hypothetical protein DKG75_02065 [Zavarzinia compransoris]TDP46051.1 hypothetical protein DES42_104132 [Zavarzinia compransoris]
MARPSPLADGALRFLSVLALWEAKAGHSAGYFHGRRGARLLDELGELRRLTARLAVEASAMSMVSDPAEAEEAFRRLLVRLRETDAVPWPRVIEIVNDVAEATVKGRVS